MSHEPTPLRVTHYGEPVLRQAGAAVEVFDEKLKELAEQMLVTMYEEDGIGLAAQQVGKAIRLCVIDLQLPPGSPEFHYRYDGKTPPLDLIMPMALVNPEVTVFSEEMEEYEEGCLSFPDIRGPVSRPARIEVSFQDLDGNPHQLEAAGLLARVILHENDHLNGVLFIDHMSPRELKKIETRVKKLKRETRQWLRTQT